MYGIYIYICVSNLMSLTDVILFKTSVRVLGVPCPSSGDTIYTAWSAVTVNCNTENCV
jgi:hypothetical protein